MTQEHPITPPPELVQHWLGNHFGTTVSGEVSDVEIAIATQAACWGADAELEACCEWVYNSEYCQPHTVLHLRSARRPTPPSLKEQALAALDDAVMRGDCITISDALPTIRRALEQLDD